LGAGIDQELEWSAAVDFDRHHNECLLNNPKGYTGDVSGAVGFSLERGYGYGNETIAGLWFIRMSQSGRDSLARVKHRRTTHDQQPGSLASKERPLTANPEDTPVTSAVLSPDGKYLAYTDATGFYLREVDSAETHAIPLEKGFEPLAESWFPDRSHLVVSWTDDPQRQPSLWKISVFGGPAQKLSDAGYGAAVRLTLDERLDLAMAWTADSKAVVFYSNRNGPFHIFKQNIHSAQPVLLVGGPDDLYAPRMTPDQSAVLYIVRARPNGTTDEAQLMRIPVDGGVSQPVLRASGLWDAECARAPS
jgi:Tol biopolymer transport system component